MADTYLLPEVHIVITQTPGVDGTSNTARLAQIESDLATLLGRPVITELNDIVDVNAPAPAEGQTIIWDEAAGEYINGVPDTGIEVQRSGSSQGVGVTRLNFNQALNILITEGGQRADIFPVWGGTGTADSFSRSDHTHTNPLPIFQPFNATGYMSGGTRQVVSRSVVLAAGIRHVVIARFRPQMRGADPGAGYFTMTTAIAGNSRTSPGGQTSGFWCVQGVPNKEEWVHAREIVGTGSSITVTGSVAYHSGAGFNVDAGELEIEVKPDR